MSPGGRVEQLRTSVKVTLTLNRREPSSRICIREPEFDAGVVESRIHCLLSGYNSTRLQSC